MAELYPVFTIPSVNAETDNEETIFRPCPLFDFETGDFVTDGANRVVVVEGRDAYILWVVKMIHTQEGACLSYIDLGIDVENSLQEPSREAIESALERTISDTLLRHPCTDRVYDFEYTWEADSLAVSFTIKPKSWPSFDISMNVVA